MKRRRKPPKKTGRPSLYDPDGHPKIARKIIGEGKTLGDLAEMLGVSRFTIDQWRTNHAEFSGMIELGREDATDVVERSLHKRAAGYDHPSEKIVVVDGMIERVQTTEHYPADVSASKFWLTNKRKDQWQEKATVTLQGLDAMVEKMAAARKRAKGKPE